MTTKDKIIRVLWILVAIIAVAAIVCLIVFSQLEQQWKGVFLASGGGFLVFNLLLSIFLIKRNFK
jgi:uncharacterized membrane protein